jgi:hypothetical protein
MEIGIREPHRTFGEAVRAQRFPWLWLRLGILVALVGVIHLASSDAGFPNVAAPGPTIRVRVNNYTQASPTILAKAEREAERILAKAGLQMVWLDCPMEHYGGVHIEQNPCLEPLEATDIVLRVLSDSARSGIEDTVFGFAVVPIVASVYFEYASRLARYNDADFEVPLVLGCVIAHEIGHLLLGHNGHSATGIMQPRWERRQFRQLLIGEFLFTPEQSKRLQAEAERRTSVQNASVDEQRMREVRQRAEPERIPQTD